MTSTSSQGQVTQSSSEAACCFPQAAALALGRWALGFIFFFFGLGKFAGISDFAQNLAKQFEKTWLPSGLVSIFGHVLPFLEVTLGLLLILGLFRNVALFATGVLLLVLTFGQILLGQGQTVFFNTAYLFMTAALLFLHRHDRWVIFPRGNAKAPTP